MSNCRTNFIILLLFWPLLLMSQSQDFWISDFHKNMTDLSAISSNVKDVNGNPTALIRFAVRDSKFVFNANLGIVKQEKKTGEVWLFVPVGTKRLTISHPYLGILRGFEIPTSVESKCTYEAEIVITNKAYLDALLEQAVISSASSEIDAEEPDELESDLIQDQDQAITSSSEIDTEETDELESDLIQVQEQPSSYNEDEQLILVEIEELKGNDKGPKDSINVVFYVGVGFNALSLMGPSAHLGIGYGAFRLEAGYVFGLDKVKDIAFTASGAPMPAEIYDYSCNKFWVRIGGALNPKSKFKVTPQVGVTLNMIKGKVTGGSKNSHYYQKSNPMSVFGALRLSYDVAKWLSLHVTPQYDFALSNDEVYGVIKTVDSKIKAWGEGFGVNVGLLFHF